MNISGCKDLVCGVFSQILEGEDEHFYELEDGAMTVRLFKGTEYHTTVMSRGAMNVSCIADRVREFINTVDLSDFLKISDESHKGFLNSIFSQIINGEKELVHNVPHVPGNIKVNYSVVETFFSFSGEQIASSFAVKNIDYSTEKFEALKACITKLLSSKNLKYFFGMKK